MAVQSAPSADPDRSGRVGMLRELAGLFARRVADLSVGKKLLVIYLLDLCAVLFVSGILVNEKYIAINFSRKELQGVAYIDSLRPMLIALTRSDNSGPDPEPSIRELDRLEARLGHGLASSETSLRFAEALRALIVDDDTPVERRNRQQAALLRGCELLTRVGNQSNMMVDPNLDTNYTMSLILLRYPALLKIVWHMMPKLQAGAERALDLNERTGLFVLEGQLRLVSGAIASDFSQAVKASPALLRERLAPSQASLKAAMERLGRVVAAAEAGSRVDPAEIADARGSLLDALDRSWATNSQEAARLIELRVHDFFVRMALHLGTEATLLGFILFAVYYVAQRISRPLSDLSGVVDTVRRTGDHTLRSNWSSNDEIGRLVLGFNEMLAQLDQQRLIQQELIASARAAEAQQRLLELMPVPLMVTSIPDHRVLHANPQAREWLGDSDADPWATGLTPAVRRRFFQQLADQDIVDEFEVRWQRGGTATWSLLSARRLDYQGHDAVVTAFTPINGLKALEQRLELWAKVFEASSEGIVLLGAAGEVLSANHAFCKGCGLDPAELPKQRLGFVMLGEQAICDADEPWSNAESRGWWRGEVQVRRRGGGSFPAWAVLTAVRDAAGTLTHYIFSCLDITDRKASEEQVRFLAHHDVLTGLPNRSVAERRLKEAMQQSVLTGKPVAVLFIDLDRFKTINDSLGHQTGDALLKRVSQRLRLSIREIDEVSRFGGDEFVVLLNGVTDGSEALHIAQRLAAELRAPYAIDDLELNVSSSIGVALFPDDAADMDELMRHADAAMYQAKASGRDSVYFFTRDLNDRAQQKLQVDLSLRNAITRGEFELVYQPQVGAIDGGLNAVEALLRWHSPELGEVDPAVFIPLAEESRLIVPIGEWVIDEACRQMAEWRARGVDVGAVSVNLSAVQLLDPGLIQALRSSLERHRITPGLLELELTESTLMDHADDRLEQLGALKELGVQLSIDDFGTGYSSLSYLSRLPMAKLKIDRSLVEDMLVEPKDRAITEAIVALAHRLKMTVVAEGVETAPVHKALAEAWCDAIQGYHTGRPMKPETLEQWIADRATVPEWKHGPARGG